MSRKEFVDREDQQASTGQIFHDLKTVASCKMKKYRLDSYVWFNVLTAQYASFKLEGRKFENPTLPKF